MTGQKVSRRSTVFGRVASSLALLTAVVAVNTPASTYAQTFVPQDYANYQAGPSGSVSGDVVNFNGRGAGVLLRGGHVAGKTVGRTESISHLGAMPYATFGESLIFGDARLVRTNENGLAWSFGSGFRHYFSDVDAVLGLNGYFDRDQHTGEHFKEWGVGAELLSHHWEWRGNLYRPFGTRQKQIGIEAVPNTSVFVGNELRFDQIRSLATSLEGYDTEIGFLLPGRLSAKHQVRVFGGVYHFDDVGTEFTGWKARAQANLFDWLEMNVQVTDDEEYETNVTFGVAVNFGGYRENIAPANSRYRLGEPVRRNYTFTTDTVRVRDEGVTAIDPATNLPLDIVHVNSGAGLIQNGTVEFPFRTIGLAQATGADLMFVHAGSEYLLGPDNEVIMDGETRILGEGLIVDTNGNRATQHFVNVLGPGAVELGASPDFIASDFTLGRPLLSGSAGNTVTLADDVEFSGFQIALSGGDGIFGTDVENVILNQNDIRNTIGDGISLVSTFGEHQIIDTAITGANGVGFHVNGGAASIIFGQTSSDSDPGQGRVVNSNNFAVRVRNTLEDGLVDFSGGVVPLAGSPDETVTTFGATIDDDGGTGVSLEDNAGDVTLDNLRLANSTSHAINVNGGTGTFTFVSSIRDDLGIQITNPALNGVNIENLGFGGQVNFAEQVLIDGRGESGFNFAGIAGAVTIRDAVRITGHNGLTGAAVSFIDNEATGDVHFRDSLLITSTAPLPAGLDTGILVSGNVFDAATGNRASLRFGRNTAQSVTMERIDGDNVRIVNDAALVQFAGDLNIFARGPLLPRVQTSHGILIQNSSGRYNFNGTTFIENPNDILDSALEVDGSRANIRFQNLAADNTLGDPGILLTNNIDTGDGLGDADIVFTNLDVVTGGDSTSLFALNNSSIRVFDGTIEADPGAAVDIEASGIDMRFSRIESTDADPFAIRIVDTFKATQSPREDSTFEVFGDPDGGGAGTGGTIQGAEQAGAFLRNAGIVRLNQMEFEDNNIGVDVAYSGLLDAPSPGQRPRVETGLLELDTTDFEENDVRALDGVNVPRLLIADSEYDDHTEASFFQTIRLQYDEDPSEDAAFQVYEYPFFVSIRNTEITHVDITNAVDIIALPGAAEASLELDIQDNTIDATFGDLLSVNWNGHLFGVINTNTWLMNTAESTQAGVFINNDNDSDRTELEIIANTWDIDDVFVDLTNNEKWALLMELDGRGDITVNTNQVTLDGDDLNGFEFEFGDVTQLRMDGNSITDNGFAFANEDNRGVFIDRIGEGSTFSFGDNAISLLGDDARGLEIDAFGVVNLRSSGPNFIQISPFGDFEFDYAGATPNGQLLINGLLVP